MKKLIYILPLILWGCTHEVIEDVPQTEMEMDIFEVQNTIVDDGETFKVNFDSNGEYKLSLVDEFTNITYTNEKLNAKVGSNILTIYTKALPKGSYKFIIKDNQNNIVKQTKIKL